MNNYFFGPFKNQLDSYYQYKVNLGYKFESEINKLMNFDKYTLEINATNLSLELIYEYMNTKNIKQNSKASIISALRGFINYLYQHNLCNFLIPTRIYRRKNNKIPYIFNDNEINMFFKTASYFFPDDDFKNKVILLCFKLLYCTGMRVSECLSIKFEDIDFDQNAITLYTTKNNVDRRIIVNDDLINDLLELKNNYINRIYDDVSDYIFIRHNKRQYTRDDIYAFFRKILFYSNIEHTERGPRVHDFRHTFCVRSYQKILKEGGNYYNQIVALSAYVGHKNFISTEYYLRLTSELYPEIREKIENYSDSIIVEMEKYDYE